MSMRMASPDRLALAASQNKKELEFWLDHLAEITAKSRFPFDFPATERQAGKYNIFPFRFSEAVSSRLIEVSKGLDHSLNAVLISGLSILLARYNQTTDILIGSPIYRQEDELEFINTILPIRLRFADRSTFKEILLKAGQVVRQAVAHYAYPMEYLAARLQIGQVKKEYPLFDTAILLENIHDKAYIEHCPLSMIFCFKRSAGKIDGHIVYNPSLYQPSSLGRIVGHFNQLLQQVLFQPELPFSDIDIVTEGEKRELLWEFNNWEPQYFQEKTIRELFENQVSKTPDQGALCGNPALSHESVLLTYRELDRQAQIVAQDLVRQGARGNEPVAIQVERSLDMIVGILGILKAGSAYVPLNPGAPEARNRFILEDTGAEIIIGSQTVGANNYSLLRETAPLPSVGEGVGVRGADLAYIIYTSGSTGQPKGIPISHANLSPLLHWGHRFLNLGTRDRTIQNLSYFFDWSVWEIFITLTSGACLYSLPEELMINSDSAADFMLAYDITVLHATPTQFQYWLASNRVFPTLKYLCLGAEKLPHELVKRSFSVVSPECRIFNMYGPTEATIIAAILEIERGSQAEYARLTSVPIGFPTANNQLLILDPYLHLCPIRVTGELFISGSGVATGYINQPDLTGKRFLENPYATSVFPFQYIYRTGDLCRWLNDGSIEFIGRIDNQVKIRGFRIEPGEIENRLLAHPEVRDAVVIDQERPGSQEKFLCAYFVPEKTGTKIQPEALREFLSLKLPDYMVPAYFIEISNIPLNPNGKVDRNALPEPGLEKTTPVYMAPRDETEKKLARLWEEILDRPAGGTGIDDNFFQLGGHSLKGTVLISRIHKEFDVRLSLADLFKTPTIRALSHSLSREVKDEYGTIPPAEKKEYYVLSSAQKRLYILNQLEPDSIHYNILQVFQVPPSTDRHFFENAFREMIARHESFRTSFIMPGDEPRQRVLERIDFELEVFRADGRGGQGPGLGAAAIPGTSMLNRIAESPQFVKPQAKLSTVLAGSEGDCCESLTPDWQLTIIKKFIRPFDLTRAPLLRVGWIGTGDGDHFLLIDMHHIISDGVSIEIFHRELARLYRLDTLPPLRLHYRDYAEWQNSGPEKEKKKKQEEFWLKEFSGEIPVLNLPLDFPRPAIQSFRGDAIIFELTPAETAGLNKLAKENKVTLFMVLLAIFNVLLAKLSGQEDIVIGTPTAGRRHADLEPVIGMFVNTLPLRHSPSGREHFNVFLKKLGQRTLDAFENQEYPFEELVEQPGLSIARDTGRNPLFDVMFVLQNQQQEILDHAGLGLIPYDYERKQAKFDMTLGAVEERERLVFAWEYCTDLFRGETVERFIGYFLNIIVWVSRDPGARISQIEVMSREEQEQVMWGFNRQETEYMRDATIQNLFLSQVERTPDSLALVGPGENGQRSLLNAMSYRGLADRAGELAGQLRSQGIRPNGMVGIMAERGPGIIIGMLGVLLAGGVYVPLNPKAPEARNRFILDDTGAEIIISYPSDLTPTPSPTGRGAAAERSAAAIPGKQMNAPLGRVPILSSALNLQRLRMLNRIAESPQFVKPQAKLSTVLAGSEGDCCVSSAHQSSAPADLAYVIYTSGSTGQPKGVPISHANLCPLLHWGYRHLNLGSRDRTIQNLSYYFDWSVWEISITLTSGACLYSLAEELMLNADSAADIMQTHDITVLHATPTQFQYLLAADRVFPTLKHLCLGAEKLTHDLVERSFSAVGSECRIYNMYGPTEATIIAAVLEIERDRDDDYARLTSVPIGFSAGNTPLLVLDRYMNLCPIRVTGELYIGGDGVARGYLNNPELTAEKFVTLSQPVPERSRGAGTRLYKTGDLARFLENGAIEFLGRVDFQVKIRGFRIELGEIENRLLAHPEVRDAVVIDRERPDSQEKFLCAYFVPEKTGTKIQPEVLREFLSLKLPDYMVPAYFIEISNIPLNPNGKVDRNALPEPGLEKTTPIHMAPRDETEKKLARLWEEILGRPAGSTGIDDNFFQLGGHSLKGTVLISRMHKDFDVKLTLADLFKTPTIRALSDSLRAKVQDKFVFIPRGEKKEYYVLSSAQKRLYILDQLEPGSINYNIPMVYRVPTQPDQELLADSFWEMIERHESFRTSFIMVGHEPKQHILPIDQVEFKIEFYDRPCPTSQTGQASQIEIIIKKFIQPFDLTRAPLLRVGWIDTGDGDYFLLIDMHHIISDGVSMEIFHQELARVYGLESLPPLRLQYRDYAEWQNSGSEKKKKEKQEKYWVKEFSGEIPVLNLPLDFPRPAMQSFRGDSVSFGLNPEETGALNKWAREQEITLFMVLLAILDVLLAKLSGQEDIVIGTPTAGRRHADLEPVIGMFVNTLPLRHFPAGQKRFDDFSKEAWQKTMQAFENQEYPFEELLEQPGLGITRDTSRNPLFDVMFALQNQAGAPQEKTGLELIPYAYERKQAKFDMTLGAVEEKGELLFEWEYCTDLFHEQTMERFIGYFRNLVASVIGNPGIEIRQMDVMPGKERERILGEFNRLGPVYRPDGTIRGLFLDQVQRIPDCLALKGGRLENSLSYRELADRAGLLAADLRARGVGSNVMVGVKADRGVEIIIGILGILLAGGAYVPLNPKAPETRNRFILDDTGTEIIISSQTVGANNYSPLRETGVLCSAHRSTAPADLAYVIYTSGSTGQPKGVPICHSNLSPLLHWGYRHLNLGSRDRTIQNLSYYFDWSVWEIFITLTSGACLYTVAEEMMLSADAAADFMQKHDITVLHSTPTQFLYLLATGRVFPTLKYLCLGAEKLTPDLVKRSFQAVGQDCRIFNMYGPTEATIIAAVLEIERSRQDEYDRMTSVPIGFSAGNTPLLVLDRYMNLCPIRVTGELYIGGDGVAQGYLNNPELTAEKFVSADIPIGAGLSQQSPSLPAKTVLSFACGFTNCGLSAIRFSMPVQGIAAATRSGTAPLHGGEGMGVRLDRLYKTGDLARFLEDGSIEFLGRIDNQVKIRGFRIELGEIESTLLSHERLDGCVVVVTGDQNLCAYYVPRKKTTGQTVTGDELRKYVSAHLPGYMVPAYFVRLEKIPLNANGKVDRPALPNPLHLSKTGDAGVLPRTSVEKRLARLWADVLNMGETRAFIDDNFFQSGGHSLKGTVLISKIHQEFQVHLTLADLFKTPTIKGLAAMVKKGSQEKYLSLEIAEKKEYYRLSSSQKRLYIVNQIDSQSLNYNIPAVYRLPKEPDLTRLRETFSQLIARHESFRTSFIMVEDEPVQRVLERIDFELEVFRADGRGGQGGRGGQELIESTIRGFIRPFDLSRPPLLRVGLIETEEKEYFLLFDMHHIISDGVSMSIFLKELIGLYQGEKLPPVGLHYKDFAEWQQGQEQKERYQAQKAYWQAEFSGEIPILQLPLDFPRPALQDFSGGLVPLFIGPEDLDILKRSALKQGATLYMLLLSIFSLLVARLSGQEEVVMGSPVAGRRHPELQGIIGMFINTLGIRSFPRGDESFSDYLKEIISKSLDAFENQEYPFEELVEQVNIERDASRNPLFDVMFLLQNMERVQMPADGLSLVPYEYDHLVAKVDLTLVVYESGGGLMGALKYCRRLFREETARRFVQYFLQVSRSISRNPGLPIKDIEILPAEEKEKLLYEFNHTSAEFPGDSTLHQLFADQVSRTPDRLAVTGRCLTADMVQLSYRELNERADELAVALRKRGVVGQTIAALMADRTVEIIAAILGILKTGGAYLPIDPDYPQERIDYMLADSGAEVVIGSQTVGANNYSPLRETGVLYSARQSTAPTDLAYVIYTSGTTGKPKGVMIRHRSVINLLTFQEKEFAIDHRERILQFSSLCFDPSVEQVFLSLHSGSALILVDKETILDVEEFPRYIARQCITHLHAVPAFLNNIDLSGIRGIKRILCGADVCPVSLADRLRQYGDFYNKYGPTETTIACMEMRVNRQTVLETFVPIGRPVGNTVVFILDKWLKPVPLGVVGELYIGGEGMALGYLNCPELTVEKFVDSIIPIGAGMMDNRLYGTGDLCRWLSDGNIEFRGRMDYQVKIRGFRIELGEIENYLLKHEQVREAVVIDRQRPGLPEKYLCAYIVPKNKGITGLGDYLARFLPEYMIPAYFVEIDEIPLNSNGKVVRKALPEPGHLDLDIAGRIPRDPIEEKLVQIWSEILKIDKGVIGINDNFFQLGGHSLNGMILLSRSFRAFNVRLSLGDLFKSPSIRGLAAIVKQGVSDTYLAIGEAEKKEYYPLSFSQKNFYVLNQIDPQGKGYHIFGQFILKQQLDLDELERSVRSLIKRHETLRTSFWMIGNEPVQRISNQAPFHIEYHDVVNGNPVGQGPADEEVLPPDVEQIVDDFLRPFDLSLAPLLRIGLLKLAPSKYLFLFDLHHIISDAISFQLFLKEFASIYSGRADMLPECTLQYKDYSEWQKKLADSGELKKQEEYWLKEFSMKVPELGLPLDFPRPSIQDFSGDGVIFDIPEAERRILRGYARQADATMFMVMLSLFALFLSKISGQQDVVVGSPVAGRRFEELYNIMGVFVNTLALRHYPRENITYAQFLDDVKRNTLQAFENQDFQFEELVRRLGIPRESGRNPIFDVLYNYILLAETSPGTSQAEAFGQGKNPFLDLKPYRRKQGIVFLELVLNVEDNEGDSGRLTCTLGFRTSLFTRQTVEGFSRAFLGIVSAITKDKNILLKNVQVTHNLKKAETDIPGDIHFDF